MGCGGSASQQQADSQNSEKEELVRPFGSDDASASGEWASKSEKSKDKPGMAFEMSSQSKATGDTKPAPVVVVQAGNNDAKNMRMIDADSDDDLPATEVIDAGKTNQASFRPPAANGQEPPDENDSVQAAAEAAAAAERQKAISARQIEEAAKLAEQRKKFEEKKYQREMGYMGGQALPLAGGSTTSGGVASSNAQVHSNYASPGGYRQDDQQDRAMMFGLNLSKAQQPIGVEHEELPGFISDTPRKEDNYLAAGKQKNNQHDRFDDDDLRIMNEILDGVD